MTLADVSIVAAASISACIWHFDPLKSRRKEGDNPSLCSYPELTSFIVYPCNISARPSMVRHELILDLTPIEIQFGILPIVGYEAVSMFCPLW